MMKVSIHQQLEEVSTVRDNMLGYLGEKVKKRRMRPQELAYRMDRLSAVERTLKWLAENEEDIKSLLAAKKDRPTL